MREGRIDLQAVLDADAAHRIVHAALLRLGVERTRAGVSLPWRAMTMQPGDRIDVGGAVWRVAAVTFEQMVVKLELVRLESLSSPDLAASPGRNVSERDVSHGATVLAVVDLPPITDAAQSQPAVTIFANGASAGWRRAALLASVDGGVAYVPAGSTALPATMGATSTALAPAPAALIDRANTVDVELLNSGMALFDADMPSLLAGANLAMIGDELIQFGRAVRVGPQRWQLGELWRGRRGTEDAIIGHPSSSRFILIDPGMGVVLQAHLALPGVKVMASGIGDASPYPTASCATASRAIMPLAPVALIARPLSGGDTQLCWTRRSRDGWAWRDGVDAPIAEEREAYRITWAEQVYESAESRFDYTAAMRSADIAAGRTAVTFLVRQIGALALSPAAAITIDIV